MQGVNNSPFGNTAFTSADKTYQISDKGDRFTVYRINPGQMHTSCEIPYSSITVSQVAGPLGQRQDTSFATLSRAQQHAVYNRIGINANEVTPTLENFPDGPVVRMTIDL